MTSLQHDDAVELFRAPPTDHLDVSSVAGSGAVAYRKIGTGPDVLFVHGWPTSGVTYAPMLPHLADHVTCHVIDQLGAGSSRFDRSSRIGIRANAATVRAVVDELGLTDVAVVGHDSGGLIARLALAGDERVRAWGLIDTETPGRQHWRFSSFLAIRKIPRYGPLLARLLNSPLRRNKFVVGDAYADRALLDGVADEFYFRPLRDDPERLWAATQFADNFDTTVFDELADLHARITAPVQLVWGSKDAFFPVAAAKKMAGTFGGPADLHVIDGAKLFSHEEFPEAAAAALLPTVR